MRAVETRCRGKAAPQPGPQPRSPQNRAPKVGCGSIPAVAAAVALPRPWAGSVHTRVHTDAGAVRQSDVYCAGFTLAGPGRMPQFAHMWRQYSQVCRGAPVEHRQRHELQGAVLYVAPTAVFPAVRQLYSNLGDIWRRRAASAALPPSATTAASGGAVSSADHRRHRSTRDETATSERTGPPSDATEGDSGSTSLDDRPRQTLRGIDWVLTRRIATVSSPPGTDSGLSSLAHR